MKKGLGLLLIIPFLCSCSGAQISTDQALSMINEFEIKLEQKTSFSFYERKAVYETSTSRSVSLTQIFFEDNFFHSYNIYQDLKNVANSTAVEKWSFIKDKMIYDVTTEDAEDNPKGKSFHAYTFEKEVWEERIKDAFEEVRKTNSLYLVRIKNEIKSKTDQTKIDLRSKNSGSLIHKIERYGNEGKVIRYKSYEFQDSLIYNVVDKDDYSVTTIDFRYKVSTQEPNIPDF